MIYSKAHGSEKGVYPKKRIIHDPRQISDISQLEKGRLYQRMRKVGGEKKEGEKFFFLSKTKNNRWIIIREDFADLEKEVSLADIGVISYDNGVWNPRNYIISK